MAGDRFNLQDGCQEPASPAPLQFLDAASLGYGEEPLPGRLGLAQAARGLAPASSSRPGVHPLLWGCLAPPNAERGGCQGMTQLALPGPMAAGLRAGLAQPLPGMLRGYVEATRA